MDSNALPKQGPKPVVRGKKAVCSSSHPIVTDAIIDIMRQGGNAADAAVAASILQPVIEPHMTTHGGSVDILYYEAKTGKVHQLLSTGTLVPDLPPFRPLPPGLGGFAGPLGAVPPCACIPGFVPGLGAFHARFGTQPWSQLCQPAIHWADEGHPVSSFEFGVLSEGLPSNTYFPAAREIFAPDGYTPQVGDPFRNPKLAQTLRRLADEGPEYFTKSDWAKHFVAEANRLGWPITMEHLTAIPPRWGEPLRYSFRGNEVCQLYPPEMVGVVSSIVLGVLDELGVDKLGHYSDTADGLYYMAHVLRRAAFECGLLNDPANFDVPVDVWLSKGFHQHIAEILRKSRPIVDLSGHVRATSGNPALAAMGLPTAPPSGKPPTVGSCELSIVDAEGNWVEMINTIQTGGIPGDAVDGVFMWGSHAVTNMGSVIAGWHGGGSRIRCIIGSTIVLKDGKPWLAFGTPGTPSATAPQVLWNILGEGMDPYEATVGPRLWPMRDDYVVEVEARVPETAIAGLVKMGVRVRPINGFEYHLGSFQVSWRDPQTGLLSAGADHRRAGKAGGL